MRRLVAGGFFLVILAVRAAGLPAPDEKLRSVTAVRLAGPVVIDGRLLEAVWQGPAASGFRQRAPHDGSEPTEPTRVWVAYDDRALYVAARLADSNPRGIIGLLGRRDDLSDSDWFHVALDPRFDQRSGFRFSVNPAGSLADGVLHNDTWEDSSWDGIWEARAVVDEHGWSVELRIPFDQLRFPERTGHRWGVNFERTVARKHETTVFAWRPREENPGVSAFAELTGLRGIRGGRRLELLPYATGQIEVGPAPPADPFAAGRRARLLAGADAKLGFRSDLTLDLTVNPDFGQVEVDPAEVNLTAFETYYPEKRPFFVEGAQTFAFGKGGATKYMGFDWEDPAFFYSRRIGRAPEGPLPPVDFAAVPGATSILAAAKLTGHDAGWNLGALTAVTAREYADLALGGERWREEIEPAAWHGALRLQREFNQGRRGVGVIVASLLRSLDGTRPREGFASGALAFGADGWTILGRNRTWALSGWFGGTRVAGSAAVIDVLQRSSLHYFQRPGENHLDYDPAATSLSGWGGRLQLSKEKGRFSFHTAVGAISPGFDCSETGFQFTRSDRINAHVALGYDQPHPRGALQNWSVLGAWARSYDFGGTLVNEEIFAYAALQLRNYWQFASMTDFYPGGFYNDTLTRGGPLVWMPRRTYADLSVESDTRRKLVLTLFASGAPDALGNDAAKVSAGLRWKPAASLSLGVAPAYSWSDHDAQWVGEFDASAEAGPAARRHVFASLERRTASAEIRLHWIFSPRMSLQVYVQPYISAGCYRGFKELARPRSRDFFPYGSGASTIAAGGGEYRVDPDGPGPQPAFSFSDPDFNVKSLRGTAVFRWEYRPGSVFYLVWTQERLDVANPGDFHLGRGLADLFAAPGSHVVMAKFSHRLRL